MTVGLVGEPGVGKSHTVRSAFAALTCRSVTVAAAGDLRHWARALPRPLKLASWSQSALDDIANRLTMPVADIAAAFGAVLSASAPILLHVEDLHESDAARQALIVQLGKAVHRSKGVGIVVTSRVHTPEPFTPQRLEPLDARASQRLLE
ncbi:MAG TPA: AAA family ATPase, partial [Trueperaceae bacterium]|nr:AAA family ATPase [Trueperaceae bacterium]